MIPLVERLKHRRRNPKIMVDRRNRMIREMLNNIVLPGDIERRT